MPEPAPTDLRLYGKLPISKEFFTVRCFGGAAGELRQWIDGGFDLAVRGPAGGKFRLEGAWRLLLYFDRQRDAVIARLRDSRDASLTREYPLGLFVTTARLGLSESVSVAVQQAWSVGDELELANARIAAVTSGAELQSTLDSSRPTVPTPERVSTALDVPLESWRKAWFGERDRPEALSRLLLDVRKAYRRIQRGDIRGSDLPGLALPLAPEIDLRQQVVAWTACLEASGFLRGRRAPVSVAWPERCTAPGCFWILIRPPLVGDLRMLAAVPEGYLFPSQGDATQPFEDPRPRLSAYDQVVASPGATLADLARLSLEA